MAPLCRHSGRRGELHTGVRLYRGGRGFRRLRLANRLSADGRHRVLVLEAGPKDWNPWIHVPVSFARTLKDPSVNWLYETEKDPGSDGRRHVWPRGRVLGGSSSINGLLYVRGQMADYDGWAQPGARGWGSADVLPYFRRAEGNERLSGGLHGADGPLNVSDATTRLRCPMAAGRPGSGPPRRVSADPGRRRS